MDHVPLLSFRTSKTYEIESILLETGARFSGAVGGPGFDAGGRSPDTVLFENVGL